MDADAVTRESARPQAADSVVDAPRAVLVAACAAVRAQWPATLAVVVDTEGSTYVGRGAAALFIDGQDPVGWLSGGCLEPEIARHAAAAAGSATPGWLDIDTRDDEDLLSGSSAGCRGRLHLLLLPLMAMPGMADVLAAWLDGGRALAWRIGDDGTVEALLDNPPGLAPSARATAAGLAGAAARRWQFPAAKTATPPGVRIVLWPPAPELLLFGAGPETAVLLPTLHSLGWRTTLVERRPRWRGLAEFADAHVDATPSAALASCRRADAALVMHHHFELDREALHVLADTQVGYVGLLGPARRRDDLFRVLSETARDRLRPRLRSPVGLDLGGHGAAAIALSIAAELQAWRHAREPAR